MISDLITSNLAGVRCARILDVGPGFADFSRIAARVTGAASITFIDCDPEVLAWQAARCRDAGIEPTLLSMTLEESAVATIRDRYCLIHCQEVLEHLPGAEGTLRALARLLMPGGRMIITVPTRRSERWLRYLNPGYMRNVSHGHVNEYSAEDLRRLIDGAGLRVLVLQPAQPHYFIAHTWMVATRMPLEGSTGRPSLGGVRGRVFRFLVRYSRFAFRATHAGFWSRLLPRNYFAIAASDERAR